MSSPLPSLTTKIAPGAAAGHEFERLLHQLLLRHVGERRRVETPGVLRNLDQSGATVGYEERGNCEEVLVASPP